MKTDERPIPRTGNARNNSGAVLLVILVGVAIALSMTMRLLIR